MITFLFVDNCPHCDEAKPRIIHICELAGLEVQVRKPRLGEAKRLNLPGYPSVILPSDPPVVLSGSNADALVAKVIPLLVESAQEGTTLSGLAVAERLRSN